MDTLPPIPASVPGTLARIDGLLARGERLSAQDGLFLYEHAPLEWLREKADAVRRARHGEEAYFNRDIHFEPTNMCVYACKFCAFYRPKRHNEAYVLTREQMAGKIQETVDVGGIEILLLLLDFYGLDCVHVSHEGLRHGMILAYLDKADDWWRA